MTRVLAKWLRKIHRWIAVPTALAIPVAFIIKLVGDPQWITTWEKFDKLPSILMLFMALTGAYLYLVPYLVKWQRKRKAPFQPKENVQSRREAGQV